MSWGLAYNTTDKGPALGGGLGKNSCTGCHEVDRGPLTSTTDLDHVRYKIVVEKNMPENEHLTDDDRKEVYNKFVMQRSIELRKWLLETSCVRIGDSSRAEGNSTVEDHPHTKQVAPPSSAPVNPPATGAVSMPANNTETR